MRLRTPELQPAVRAATVVVMGMVPKDCLQVARSDDQDPIEALGPDRLYPPFCEGVGARCPDRSANDIDAIGSEDRIEAVAVLGIAIVDEESHGRASILEADREVACPLSDPYRVGAVQPATWIRLLESSMKNSTSPLPSLAAVARSDRRRSLRPVGESGWRARRPRD
jgi:hypothetical protein